LKYFILILLFVFSCGPLKKDNPAMGPLQVSKEVSEKFDTYKEGVKPYFDEQGLVRMGKDTGVGDSALFSCLARTAGVTDFDPEILITPDGRPVRHAIIWQDRDKWVREHCTFPPKEGKSSCTPVSRDMVSGLSWCLLDLAKEDTDRARKMVGKIINYGRSNSVKGIWNFCSAKDIYEWNITLEDQFGRCMMSPQLMKDIYRIAIKTGWTCDEACLKTMLIGTNAPIAKSGFERHLAVTSTVRNGIVEGSINDNSLGYLKRASEEQPNNALYQAAYRMFSGGDQSKTFEILLSDRYPKDHVPDSRNYCSDYLYQRDEVKTEKLVAKNGCIEYLNPNGSGDTTKECGLKSGKHTRLVYNDDWLPCPSRGYHHGPGIEWLFAASLALGIATDEEK
jgi:hypothetical protein